MAMGFPAGATDLSVVGCLGFAITYFVWTWYLSYTRLSHIPGPRGWAWSVWPLFKLHLGGAIHDVHNSMSRQYGPLVRISPSMLLLSDPEELRRINAARSPYTRAPWYVAMRLMPGVDSVFSTRDEQDHNERRKKMAAGYSGRENIACEGDIDDTVLELVHLIDSKYVSNPPEKMPQMDLGRKIQFFTTDVTSKLAFDDKFHDLRDDNDNHGYIKEIEDLFPNLFCLSTVPELVYFLTKAGVLRLLEPSVKANFGLGKAFAITNKAVAARFDAEGKPQLAKGDMLASFLRHGLTQSEAEHEGVLQLIAGSDTTATAIRSTLLCIMSNPRVHAKLIEEIHDAIKADKVSAEWDSIISNEQAKTLPYLQACIKEGLRWFPPLSGLMAKLTPPEGDMICGYKVPGGVSIGYSVNAVHSSPALYGPDEEVFRPERWIHTSAGGDEPSLEKLRVLETTNEMIFGMGKYQCLGKNVASIELNKVVFELMRKFELSLVNPLQPWKSTCYGIHFQRDFFVTVRRRRASA